MNIDNEIASSMLNASYADDLKTAVHVSLKKIRDMLLRKCDKDEIILLTQQMEALLAEHAGILVSINRDLVSFNYSVANALCPPLEKICGLNRALHDRYAGALDLEGLDHLERIFKSSQHMNELIDALLQLSRLSSQSLEREEVDLSGIASETAKDLSMPERKAEVAGRKGRPISVRHAISRCWRASDSRSFEQAVFRSALTGPRGKTVQARVAGPGSN